MFGCYQIQLCRQMAIEPILVTIQWLVMPLIVLVVGWQWNEFVHHVILVTCSRTKIEFTFLGY